MENPTSRRNAMRKIIGAATTVALSGAINSRLNAADEAMGAVLKGRINHSVCRWCYNTFELDALCKAAKNIGLQSVELLTVEEFATVKKYNLTCAMVSGIGKEWGITKGWNKKENHEGLEDWYKYLIDETAKAGFKNLICFSGNRERNLDDEDGLKNCAKGLKKILHYAEKKKVTLVMELLNSRIDHPDYMCDHTDWGVELCKKIDSDNFKLLYDIYHMQIMEGDIIRRIRENYQYIAHYHTGGVPGRHEIDETQEIYYPAIMNAIVDTGFKGFVAQEFIPVRADKLASLKQGVSICDV
ncbi:Xylose isomerase domain-containing protein TIM barrel [Emticicia oligotrophica DSM 17448]|uniref:Xylose isomerase domain-containing protein TIM barrel n=1 Tax=Emticicia oligotrophica (strain DSM 17448 / CIP 109782 / MTCC 6937 / GPTSA100-15) TaxID=929562 RepID=A0ABM5MXG8_EMTOG|nr:Xylose isomerase domain-containing protein TIM barrel [Emticicia oligotrophica DSM 17448]